MRRTVFFLKDSTGSIRARLHAPEGDTPEVEPWMLDAIQRRGWRLEPWEAQEMGVDVHGIADWRAVAEALASFATSVLDDTYDWTNEAMADRLMEQGREALDNYRVAEMEVGLSQETPEPDRPAEPPEPTEEDDDGREV